MLARGVGSFQVLRSVSGPFHSPPALLSPQRERGGAPALSSHACERGRLPTLRSLRASGAAAGELRSVSRQIKTLFKKNERIWQAEEKLESLLEGQSALNPPCCAIQQGC